MNNKKKWIGIIVIAAMLIALVLCSILIRGEATHECHDCDGAGCEVCGGTGVVDAESIYSETFMALIAPVIAIVLALITKEVYSSLFVGIVVGGFLYGSYHFAGGMDAIINTGIISAVSDSAGIFAFLVILGILVSLINKAGGSQAFGVWAQKHIKSRVGAAIATFILGVLIFIDDYFNCLTVGAVMRPVTDSHKVSRVKLAYLIDATAAPVCMIAPISSWAAAVSQYAPEGEGLSLFIKAIPYNFYSLLTFVFIIAISLMGYDYGKMADFEIRARKDGDLGALENAQESESLVEAKSFSIWDLIFPIVVLIVSCVFGLIYVGGFFDAEGGNYHNFISAFGDTDATVGLPWGAVIALVISIAYFMLRNAFTGKNAGLTFTSAMKSVPNGFIAMVPAILILTFATALKNITSALGAKYFVAGLMENAGALKLFLPAVIFLVACGLAFATGTSWGTFGILIPIVLAIFPDAADAELQIIGMSACLAGAVCGDHCSPISDTTIMSSAGAQCNHVDHVATQLPYAITVALISFVSFILAGLIQNWLIVLPIGIVLTVGTLFVMRAVTGKKAKD